MSSLSIFALFTTVNCQWLGRLRYAKTACFGIGADGETRTPTPFRAPAPEASVSTNSTTSAYGRDSILSRIA
jgi:hypothetical protein